MKPIVYRGKIKSCAAYGVSDICTLGRYYCDFQASCEWFVNMGGGDKMFYKIH